MTASERLKRAQALSPVEIWKKSWWRVLRTARCFRFYSKFHRSSVYAEREMIDPSLKQNDAEYIHGQFRSRTIPRFFFDESDRERIVAQARALDPDAVAGVMAEAKRILDNRFYVHGFGEVSFKDRIKWLGGPNTYRDKLFSRHDFIPTLIQAYWYSSDHRFAERAVGLWQDWLLQSNRFQLDNSVDNSIRIQNWLWMLFSLRSEDLLEPRSIDHLFSEVYRSAYFIEANMMYAGNHRIIEALGLWHIGLFFPELKRATYWRLRGEEILLAEIERQVTEDGVHMEMSSGYHVFVTTHFLKFYVLSLINNYSVPEYFRDRLGKMLEFVDTLRKPDGEIPMFGDSDALSTIDREHREAKLLGPALSFFKMGKVSLAGFCGDLAPWYLGNLPQRSQSGDLDQRMLQGGISRSRLFPDGGYVVMRNGYDSKCHYMLMDAGPFGMKSLGHHGHADALHIEICASGKSLVIDPGGYGYVDDHWRQFFRSTRAHSTVEIDGKNQSEIFGIFGTGKTAKCEIAGWFTSDRIDFVEASHDGYEMLPSPVIHRRAIVFVKESWSYWIIVDRLEGRGEHTLELMFHLTPEARCQTGQSGEVIVHQSEATSTAIRSLNYPADKPTIVVGQTEPHIQGWVARTTGSREQAPVISFKKTASLPQTFITLVHPDCLRDRIVSVRPLPRIASDNHLEFSWELISPDLTDKVYIDQLAVKNRQHEGRLTVSIERSKAGEPIWRETVGPSRNRFVHQ